jgi:TIR domain
MAMGLPKPVIFIRYSHKDEPEHPRDSETQWLSLLRACLQPAAKHGVVNLWCDTHMHNGAEWDAEAEQYLRACDIFILLVSAHSIASDHIVDREIAIIHERQAKGDDFHFYPLLLTPVPDGALDKVRDRNLRPRDAQPFSGFSDTDRLNQMTEAANEIAKTATEIVERKRASRPAAPSMQPAYVHISRLPEMAYEHLIGRDAELKRLDVAWADRSTNVFSLVAEGGTGKSALVNEWLKQMQADNYRGAEAVLGWSFYGQGNKECATSADEFLDWAIDKLRIKTDTTNAGAKGEAIGDVLAQRRVLLVLDGVDWLQSGPDGRQAALKDSGLRALLRRFAAVPPAEAQGLVVLASRVAVKDIAHWKDSVAPVLDLERLSEEAGAALLRDNGVWGTDSELRAAALAFGGHALTLDLLASFLTETQFGDVRGRDRIREFLDDAESPRHTYVELILGCYESEWLSSQPVQHAIMRMVGLFDRPASGDCMRALREKPEIPGLTGPVAGLDEGAWQRAAARLRDARLLVPLDPAAPNALDAHPLVRAWFGRRLEKTDPQAWRAAHGRLFAHLRDTTQEGGTPTLESLAPLYQAISHGCRAGHHQEALNDIYKHRICRRLASGQIEFYSYRKLGAVGSDLAVISWFFEKPYEMPIATLTAADRAFVLNVASVCLRAQGRFAEALPAVRAGLRLREAARHWSSAAVEACSLSETELLVGEVASAVVTAAQSAGYADWSPDEFRLTHARAIHADALHAAGRREEAERMFAEAESRQKKMQPAYPLLYSAQGYRYCDLLLAKSDVIAARDRAVRILEWESKSSSPSPLDRATLRLTLGRAHHGLTLGIISRQPASAAQNDARAAQTRLSEAVDGLRAIAQLDDLPRGLLARSAFRRNVGDWDGAARDLDEVEEIAEPGPMRLHLCDMALERARLAFARIAAFAPLNGLIEGGPPKPAPAGAEESAKLAQEALANLATARKLIERCGYHRRDNELGELETVRDGERHFADLPPRV